MRVRDWIVVGLMMNGLPMAMFLHWLFIGISGMKKRKWTMKRIVDTLFVLVILGDIATMIMFVVISIKILKMQEVITWLIQQA